MTHKVFLEGELALKFGSVFSFAGNTVADAVKCIQANRPNFRKYLIECHEKDIGFYINVAGKNIEYLEECVLPLVKGDIIITPVPAGSSGEGGKDILKAVGVAILTFVATLVLGPAAGAYVAYAGYGYSMSLAIQGISKMLAPDPATDEQIESYLFNGNERTVIEGDPVPVLYGELAVPGFPIDFGVSNEG